MTRSQSTNDPIHLLPPYDETAVPMAGLATPPEAFRGRTRSVNKPVAPYRLAPDRAIDLTAGNPNVAADLVRISRRHSESLPTPPRSPAERAVLRGWARGESEQATAAQLDWTADAVREARTHLLRRIRVSFDPSPA